MHCHLRLTVVVGLNYEAHAHNTPAYKSNNLQSAQRCATNTAPMYQVSAQSGNAMHHVKTSY